MKKIKLKIETIKIKPKIRKFDIGRMPICSICGNLIQGPPNTVCCKGSKTITLRKYIEEIRKEKFDPKKWTLETKDIVDVKDMDIKKEITTLLNKIDKKKKYYEKNI